MSTTAELTASDDPEGHARTTRSLVASFAARLGALGYVSGGEAIGSQLAGIGALGKRVSETEQGSRLRTALARGLAGNNGQALWQALKVDTWLSGMPPSPVLDELRNDLAVLLAEDLDEVLETPPGSTAVPTATLPPAEPVAFLDVMVGLWAWGRELSSAVEVAAGQPRLSLGAVADLRDDGPPVDGPLLR